MLDNYTAQVFSGLHSLDLASARCSRTRAVVVSSTALHASLNDLWGQVTCSATSKDCARTIL